MSIQLLVNGMASLVLGYFVLSRTVGFLLNLLAVRRLREMAQERILPDLPQLHAGLAQPVSLLLPLCHADARAVATVQSLLQLDYPLFELIIISDGTHNTMLPALMDAFDLHPFPEAYRVRLHTQPVTDIYRSTRHQNLRVLAKQAGGMADALNAGINAARYPLLCHVDLDLLWRRDGLQRLAAPFINDRHVVAAVSPLRPAKDVHAADDFPESTPLPRNRLLRLQYVDSLRRTLLAPLGWSAGNAMLIAPAGIAMLRKDAVVAAGGYGTQAVDPDMELVVRLHRTSRAAGQPYDIRLVTDAICAGTMPDTMKHWKQHSLQWQRGLFDSLRLNRRWTLRKAGMPGWLAFPFVTLFELWGPVLETFGYLFMLTAFVCGLLAFPVFGAFVMASIGLGILLSVSALLLEELSFGGDRPSADMMRMTSCAVLFHLGYAQREAAWRAMAMLPLGRHPAAAKPADDA